MHFKAPQPPMSNPPTHILTMVQFSLANSHSLKPLCSQEAHSQWANLKIKQQEYVIAS